MGGTSQRAHFIGHPQFLIFHKVGAREVEFMEYLEIMHVSLLRKIVVEYLRCIQESTCCQNTLVCNTCMFSYVEYTWWIFMSNIWMVYCSQIFMLNIWTFDNYTTSHWQYVNCNYVFRQIMYWTVSYSMSTGCQQHEQETVLLEHTT